jgi:hypothetical protein
MLDLCRLIWCALIRLFRSRAALEAEILVLRHQLNVLRRKSPKRWALGNVDRLVFAGLVSAEKQRDDVSFDPNKAGGQPLLRQAAGGEADHRRVAGDGGKRITHTSEFLHSQGQNLKLPHAF